MKKVTLFAGAAVAAYSFYYFYPEMRRYFRMRSM
jgi:hypothetical protein